MNKEWYKKLGFYSNPFSIKPAAFDEDLVAYDMFYLYKKIDSSELLFIEGEYGTGKTTILKNIIRRFRGKHKIIYYSFDTGENVFNLKELLEGANSFWRKLSGLKVRDIILLLDEVHTMKEQDAKKLINYYKDGTLKSVIFVSHDYDLVKLPEELQNFLTGNIIRTIELSNQEAINFVRKRIGNIELLSDKVIIQLFLLADKNPRRLLEFCEDVSRYAAEIGDDKVLEFHIKEVLDEIYKRKNRKAAKKPKESKVPKEIKEKTPEVEVEIQPIPELSAEEVQTLKKSKITGKKNEGVAAPVEHHVNLKTDSKEIFNKLQENNEQEAKSKEKKFKINKLVSDDKKNTLGTIGEKELEGSKEPVAESADNEKTEDVPEYKIYFMDKE